METPTGPIAVLTGAGISAESGIPTFRDPDGFWQGYDPQQLATPQAFERDPELVWHFYQWRRGLVASGQPNAAHYLLAEIERSTQEFQVITQNVDGYHRLAGNENIIELHGSLWRLKCTHCSHRWEDHQHPLPELPPTCPSCAGLARPAVVWFGEPLDPVSLDAAFTQSRQAKLFLSVGTSSVVQPAAQLPLIAKNSGAHTIEINPEITPISALMDEVYRESASVGLLFWWENYRENLLNSNEYLAIGPELF